MGEREEGSTRGSIRNSISDGFSYREFSGVIGEWSMWTGRLGAVPELELVGWEWGKTQLEMIT